MVDWSSHEEGVNKPNQLIGALQNYPEMFIWRGTTVLFSPDS